MLILVQIDLSQADVELFDDYEEQALTLLPGHNGRLELRVRSIDGLSETHLLFFDNRAAFEGFLADPVRVQLRPQWDACGAISRVSEVQALH